MPNDNETLDRRITRLEAIVEERKNADEKALILAREILSKDIELARIQMEQKLEIHNQWQRRWDKNELTLATKEFVSSEIKMLIDGPIERLKLLIYIGMGILFAIEALFRFIKL